MKRDLVLAERVLAWMEDNTPSIGSRREDIRNGLLVQDSIPFDYVIQLLVGAGFVLCEHSGTGSDYFKLTWHGHDLLAQFQRSPKT